MDYAKWQQEAMAKERAGIEQARWERERLAGTQTQAQQGLCEATKPAQMARELIGDLARSQRTAAHELEALLKALPAELPPEADRALYHLVERGMVRR